MFTEGHTINVGRPLSLEHREKLRQAKLGKNNPQYGKKQSAEFIASRLANRQDTSNEKHANWKGDAVSYSALHKWIKRHLGKASVCVLSDDTCSKCFEWSNISGEYKRDLSDYRQLCASHHRRVDGNTFPWLKDKNA